MKICCYYTISVSSYFASIWVWINIFLFYVLWVALKLTCQPIGWRGSSPQTQPPSACFRLLFLRCVGAGGTRKCKRFMVVPSLKSARDYNRHHNTLFRHHLWPFGGITIGLIKPPSACNKHDKPATRNSWKTADYMHLLMSWVVLWCQSPYDLRGCVCEILGDVCFAEIDRNAWMNEWMNGRKT